MADNVHSVCSALGVVEWTGCYVLKSEPGSSSDRYRGVGLAQWVALACKNRSRAKPFSTNVEFTQGSVLHVASANLAVSSVYVKVENTSTTLYHYVKPSKPGVTH